jgi:HK97 family phage prohead protease
VNRTQLEALLEAGLITATAFAAALATRDAFGTITERPALELQVQARALELPPEDAEGDAARTISGIICAYEQLIPSHGLIIHTGALAPRHEQLDKIKLLRDHNMADPLGYMTAFDPDTLESSFYVPPGENGDRALLEASPAQKLRDGFSVGFLITEYEIDEDWVLHAYKADFHEVSLCAIPAVADAGVTNVAAALAASRKENTTMNRAQLAAALAAGTITQAQHDAAIATLDLLSAAPAAVPAEVAAGPTALGTPAAPPALEISDRQLSLGEVVRRVSTAANTGDVRAISLVLEDIIPSADAGEAYANRPEWLGELFTATQEQRPYIDAIGAPQPLNSLRAKGFRWADKPEVDEYAGDKEPVPSNTVSTEGDDFKAFRVAAGWDIDRAYVDFGDEQFLTDFWTHVTADYQIKSERGIRNRVKALKTNAAGTVTAGGVKAVLKQVIRDGRKIENAGVKVNRVFLSDTLFEELEDIPTKELPLWLQTASIGMDIAEGTANVGELRIGLDSTLAAGELVAFDSRGLIVRERQIPQIRAIDVANGGIDLGFTSYLRLDDVDPRLVFRRKYTPAAA